jgi:tight adherence protein B
MTLFSDAGLPLPAEFGYLLPLLIGGALFGLVYQAYAVAAAAYADYRKMMIAETAVTLGDLFSTISPERVFQLSLLGAGAAFMLVTLGINAIAGVIAAIGAFFAQRMFFNIKRDQRRVLFNQQLVDGLGMLGNSVKAGMTLTQAIELLVREMRPPLTQEFGRVLQEYRLGTDLDQALLNMARRLESRDLDVLVNSIMITRRTGGNVGEMFEKIASAIRERFRIEGKISALAATGNLQALVMSSMPFALMVVLWLFDPLHVLLLFNNTIGLFSFGVVCALVVAGFFWIRKIMDVDI